MRDLLNTVKGGASRTLCAAALLACAGAANAQDVTPTFERVKLAPLDQVETHNAKRVDIAAELAKDAEQFGQDKPRRFAVVNNTQFTPRDAGVWEDAGNGLAVWRMRFTADDARSINFGFTDYELPEKATLFVYSADGKHVVGPYTSANNSDANELWTPVVRGEDVVVELTIPIEAFEDVRLEVGTVNTAYRDFGLMQADGSVGGVPKSGSCNLDVICGAADGFPEVDAWRGQIPAVGAYTINGSDNCTGSLVNNTAQDGRPLFLTANHCGADTSPAGIVVYWNYESPTCRTPGSGTSGTPIPRVGFPTTSGSTLLMTTGGGIAGSPDTALVELNTDAATLAMIGVTYNGWDRTEQVYPSVVTIHHPGVDEKRISFEDAPVTRTAYLGDPDQGAAGTHWRIADWDLGTTEGGSSGSPLFSPQMRVIGVLSGGFASCTSQTEDWYGRLPLAWDGASAAVRLRDHLDPLNTGTFVLDGLGAGPIPFLTAGPLGAIEATGFIGGPFVGGSDSTTITNATEANATYAVTILPGGTAPITLSGDTGGTLSDGQDATFTISLNSGVAAGLGAGLYVSTVQIEDVTNSQIYTRDFVLEVGRVAYASSDVPAAIPDQGTVDSTLTISDDICIADLDVEVDISHTFSGDLVLDLIGPGGTTVRLRDREGGSAPNVNETYDDEDRAPTGPGALSDYDGISTIGTWTLRVSDGAGQDVGSIQAWSLRVLSTGGDCPPQAFSQSVSALDGEPEAILLTGIGDGALTYRLLSLPTDGFLVDPAGPSVISTVPYDLSGDLVSYVSNPGYDGVDGFTFVTDDGSLVSLTATVDITVDASSTVASFPMDSDPGWSTDGGWDFGVPAGNGGDPSSGNTGDNVYGYNLNGNYGNNINPAEYLTTTAIDYTGVTNATLCFERWLGVETSNFDDATVEVSNNGTTWTQIFLNAGGFGNQTIDTEWMTQSFDISAVADNQSTVFVRWGLQTDGSVTFAGWNVDDVVFKGNGVPTDPTGGCCLSGSTCVLTTAAGCIELGGSYQGDMSDCSGCDAPNTCLADFDNDGDVDLGDFGIFGAAFNSMTGDANYNAAADFDNDGDVDLGDFGVFGGEFNRSDCLD